MFEFVRQIPLFDDFPADVLQNLCLLAETIELEPGEFLFHENSPGDRVYLIQEGEIEILKSTSVRDVLVTVRKKGDVIGEISLMDSAPRIASARAQTKASVIAISRDQLDVLIETSPAIAKTLLRTVTKRLRETHLKFRESEKLAQLGTLTAGIAHELNNPASSVQRGAKNLWSSLETILAAQRVLDSLPLTGEQKQKIVELEQTIKERAKNPVHLDPITASDRENELYDWLEGRGIEAAADLAPALTEMGMEPAFLESFAGLFAGGELAQVLSWMREVFQGYQLADEIEMGSQRISEIVRVLKSYVYLDQAPVVDVDIHKGIMDTLVILRSKLKQGVTVHTLFAEDLPKIEAFGSELNQVWTNLIDNAIDAMQGQGEIFIRTRQELEWVVVEVEDQGPGIPEEIRSRIFDPFFTTKPQGVGTGLGLSISHSIVLNHGGLINLFTQPGKTVFEVWLPIAGMK